VVSRGFTGGVKNEIGQIRRENLARQALPVENGRGQLIARLIERCGRTYSYWRDLLSDPKKSFGEKIAREIEDKLPLPPGSLDLAPARDGDPPAKPRPGFADTRTVTDSQWALLHAVEIAATPEEKATILARYDMIERQAKVLAATLQDSTKAKAGAPEREQYMNPPDQAHKRGKK
jgi:hypothetical protein